MGNDTRGFALDTVLSSRGPLPLASSLVFTASALTLHLQPAPHLVERLHLCDQLSF